MISKILFFLIVAIVLFFYFKFIFESYIKNFNNEINAYFNNLNKEIINIKRLKYDELKNTPFNNDFTISFIVTRPPPIVRYYAIEVKGINNSQEMYWLMLRIKIFMKPKLVFKN